MPLWSRRRVLRAVAATATTATLAGCNDGVESTNTSQRRDRGEPVTGYETTTAREERIFAPFWLEEYEKEGDRPSRPIGDALVTEPPSAGSVSFDEDAESAASLRSFVEDTDFQRECVYLWSGRVDACNSRRPTGVRRQGDAVTVSVCSTPRPPDAACVADERQTFALAVRLPFAGDESTTVVRDWSTRCRDDDPEPLTPIRGDDK